MSKLIGTIKIVNGKVQLVRIGEGEKIRMGCCYRMYTALRTLRRA